MARKLLFDRRALRNYVKPISKLKKHLERNEKTKPTARLRRNVKNAIFSCIQSFVGRWWIFTTIFKFLAVWLFPGTSAHRNNVPPRRDCDILGCPNLSFTLSSSYPSSFLSGFQKKP